MEVTIFIRSHRLGPRDWRLCRQAREVVCVDICVEISSPSADPCV